MNGNQTSPGSRCRQYSDLLMFKHGKRLTNRRRGSKTDESAIIRRIFLAPASEKVEGINVPRTP